MPVTFHASKRLRSADSSSSYIYAEDDAPPIKQVTNSATTSNQYLKRITYLPPIPCTVRMLKSPDTVQRAGRCRVRFPAFAGWHRQYHKVTIMGRVMSVTESRSADPDGVGLEDDADEGGSSDADEPRPAKGRKQKTKRSGGGRPFTTIAVCDSTGVIDVRLMHPKLIDDVGGVDPLLPSWEAVMSGHHRQRQHQKRQGAATPWQLAVVPGDYVSCTAAIRLRQAFEGEIPTAASMPSTGMAAVSLFRNSPSSCVSHLVVHAQPTDAFSAEEDTNLLCDDNDRRQRLLNLSSLPFTDDRVFFSSASCRVVQDVNEITLHALSVLECVHRTKQQVRTETQRAPIDDHLLGPPLDAVVLPETDAAAHPLSFHIMEHGASCMRVPVEHSSGAGSTPNECLPSTQFPAVGSFEDTNEATTHHDDAIGAAGVDEEDTIVFDPALMVTFGSAASLPVSSSMSGAKKNAAMESSPAPSNRYRGAGLLDVKPNQIRPAADRCNDPVRSILLSHKQRMSVDCSKVNDVSSHCIPPRENQTDISRRLSFGAATDAFNNGFNDIVVKPAAAPRPPPLWPSPQLVAGHLQRSAAQLCSPLLTSGIVDQATAHPSCLHDSPTARSPRVLQTRTDGSMWVSPCFPPVQYEGNSYSCNDWDSAPPQAPPRCLPFRSPAGTTRGALEPWDFTERNAPSFLSNAGQVVPHCGGHRRDTERAPPPRQLPSQAPQYQPAHYSLQQRGYEMSNAFPHQHQRHAAYQLDPHVHHHHHHRTAEFDQPPVQYMHQHTFYEQRHHQPPDMHHHPQQRYHPYPQQMRPTSGMPPMGLSSVGFRTFER
jgi:hypothetical protein